MTCTPTAWQEGITTEDSCHLAIPKQSIITKKPQSSTLDVLHPNLTELCSSSCLSSQSRPAPAVTTTGHVQSAVRISKGPQIVNLPATMDLAGLHPNECLANPSECPEAAGLVSMASEAQDEAEVVNGQIEGSEFFALEDVTRDLHGDHAFPGQAAYQNSTTLLSQRAIELLLILLELHVQHRNDLLKLMVNKEFSAAEIPWTSADELHAFLDNFEVTVLSISITLCGVIFLQRFEHITWQHVGRWCRSVP